MSGFTPEEDIILLNQLKGVNEYKLQEKANIVSTFLSNIEVVNQEISDINIINAHYDDIIVKLQAQIDAQPE